jgi:hypothetical protein
MIRGIAFNRKKGALAAASIAAAAVSLVIRAEVARAVSRESAVGRYQCQQMVGQVQAESEFDAAHLNGLREKVSRFRGRLGDESTWGRLVGKLGPDWSLDAVTRADRVGYSVEFGTFRMKTPTVSDWQAILETVRFVEGLPGVGIGEFEMKAIGDGVQRSLSLVSMVVVVHSRSGKPQ